MPGRQEKRNTRGTRRTMLRSLARFSTLVILAAAGLLGLYFYQCHQSVEHKLAAEQQRTAELRLVVQRLGAERRVADVIVTEQSESEGVLRTTLLFVEYARDGSPLPGRQFTIEGSTAHIDALVVKFDGKFVQENDVLRGRSIALFKGIYGDRQTPEQAHRIDEPGHIPAVYRGAEPRVSRFEQELWDNFWRLAEDAAYRAQMGVRVAEGEGVWCPFRTDRLYTLTLESNGGLNITSEPLKGIYQEVLKHRAGM